jgi:3-phenylpropionate/trans-cinnamate dioxygenase ferredoxin subunit
MYNYTAYPVDHCEFIDIAAIDELEEGERLFVDVDEMPIVLFNIGGYVFAIKDVCSHDDGPLGEGDLDGYKIICPRHGAAFDVRTGKVLSLPAIVDIPAFPIKIEGGRILVGLPIKIF